jgi:hypothetical protein
VWLDGVSCIVTRMTTTTDPIVSAIARAVADELMPQIVAALRGETREVAPPPPEYMRAGEFAARMGVSRRTCATGIKRGLPVARSGRVVRVDVAAADRWLRDRERPSDDVERAARAAARRAARGDR